MGRPPFRQHGFAMRLPGGGHAPMRSHLTRRRGDLPLIDPTDRLSASGRSTRQYNDTQSIVTWVRPSSRNTILTIISGGLNIYPKEIEAVLDAQPGVIESAVIGVPHSDLSEAAVGACHLGQRRYRCCAGRVAHYFGSVQESLQANHRV
jgi:acyl-CoA synthetase (AMP-forming)/AMP-acid ligase II